MKHAHSTFATARFLALAAPLLLLACSAGGGGGGKNALTFVAPAGASAEGGTLQVDVRLMLKNSPSSVPYTVEVADAGTGSATPGADYTAFAPIVVTFPAGSLNGAVQSVAVPFLADTLVEGDETLDLALQNPSAGFAVLGGGAHTGTLQDANAASLQFSGTFSATVDEATAAAPVTVELLLAPGDTLATDVSAVLRDAGGGSATSGQDYLAVGQVPITFSTGAPSGATQDYDLMVVDDALVEGDELVNLQLVTPSSGAVIGANATHALTITDDDVSASPWIHVDSDGTPLAHNDLLDMGMKSNQSGFGTIVSVTVRNDGQAPMTLQAPSVVGADIRDFSITTGSTTPLPPPAQLPLPTYVEPFLAGVEQPGVGVSAALDPVGLAVLTPADGPRSVLLSGLQAPRVGGLALELERLPSPWADDAVLEVDGQPVAGDPSVWMDGLSLWAGRVAGLPGSTAYLATSDRGVRGWVVLDLTRPDEVLHLLPEPGVDAASGLPATRILWSDQLADAGLSAEPPTCAGPARVPPPELPLPPATGSAPVAPVAPVASGGPQKAGLSLPACRLYLETDHEFYQLFGTTIGAQDYITGMIGAISARYFTDAQVVLQIAHLGIWTTAADPWTGTDTNTQLDEFQTYMGGRSTWSPQADLAHLISARNLGGGLAYVGVLCSQSFALAVSANIGGNINWGAWTGSAGPMTWDYVVVAHEMGHQFGASHTHNYCPPLDQCSSNCVAVACGQGTIMSYCHTCAGGMSNIRIEFQPMLANIMRQNLNGSCVPKALLGQNESITYEFALRPISGTGTKTASVRFTHDGANGPSPFEIDLTGESTP